MRYNQCTILWHLVRAALQIARKKEGKRKKITSLVRTKIQNVNGTILSEVHSRDTYLPVHTPRMNFIGLYPGGTSWLHVYCMQLHSCVSWRFQILDSIVLYLLCLHYTTKLNCLYVILFLCLVRSINICSSTRICKIV